MVVIHIVAGLLAILAGFFALYSRKGATLHRRSGMVFVVAMLTMTSSAVAITAFLRPNIVNMTAGLITFYLVASGALSVMRSVAQSRVAIASLMSVAAIVGALAWSLARDAQHSPTHTIDGISPFPLYMFAAVGLIGACGDARVLWRGAIEGVPRLIRHLWRMTFAFWVAVISFFLGQPKVFPEPLRQAMGLRAIPVVLVLGTLVYWLVRMQRQRRAKTRPHSESISTSAVGAPY